MRASATAALVFPSILTAVPITLVVVVAGCTRVAGAGGTTGAAGSAAIDTVRIPPLPIPYIAGPPPVAAEAERGLEFRLVEVPASPGADTTAAVGVSAAVLGAEDAARLLAQLPALSDTAPPGFRFPPATPPPPRTGAVVTAALAPDTAGGVPVPPRATAGAAEVEVVRIVPSGETELAPGLTITFNQPMVPLTTVAGTALRQPPARLSPEPPGRWSWLDPRTLRFVPVKRFPMATEYEVIVPAGTRSATGQTLRETVTGRFATPAPRALGAYPALDPDTARQRFQGEAREGFSPLPPWSVTLQPVILIVFDQAVSPERVLAATRLSANGAPLPLRLATGAEVAADTVAAALTSAAQEEYWVALVPATRLPRNADVRIVVGSGPLSVEGPRAAGAAQELRFRTYGPLDVVWHGCDFGDSCPPGLPWRIRFNNPLDSAASTAPRLRIEPALQDMEVKAAGTELRITGESRPNTSYRVTIEGGVVDRFGQTLVGARTLTFAIGPVQPRLTLPGGPMIVLDPAGPPRIRLHSFGHRSVRVRIHRVTPEQWPAYASAVRGWSETGTFDPPGEEVASRTMTIEAPDGFSETLIDIGAALDDGLGHAVVAVEPADRPRQAPASRREASFAWVQATGIGLVAAVNGTNLLAWTTSLATGAPLAGVDVRLVPSGRRAATGADGLAVLALSDGADTAVIASRGRDSALLPEHEHGYSAGWQRRPGVPELRWLLLSDRGLYRPGETAHVKGWLRAMPSGRAADLKLATDVTSVAFRVRGPRGEELGSGEVRPGALGGFHTALELPPALNLGHATVEFEPQGVPDIYRQAGYLGLRVQEFRRPDYEVTLEADPGPHVVGEVVDMELLAKYYGGGGLGGARVQWRVTPEPATYTPPGWERWRFGRMPAWWLRQPAGGTTQTLSGTSDAAGAQRVRVELLEVDPPFPTLLRAEAQVQDVTRQVGSGSRPLLVHPAALTVGLRVPRGWVPAGDSLAVGIVVVDLSGRPVPGRQVELVRERVTWTWSPARPAEEQVRDRASVCHVVSGTAPSSCTITLGEPGTYRLRADVRDDAGRTSRTEVTVWVPGGASLPRIDPGRFELIADRDEYQPGDTARVAIEAPFFPAEGLLTVRRAGVIATERFHSASATHVLRVPITDEHISGAVVHVELVDARRGTRFASSETVLAVSPLPRRLTVAITPRDSVVAPGAETVIDVQVSNAAGEPAAAAEVALWMVDEAVLAVGGYTLPDPLAAFYPPRGGSEVRDHALRRWLMPWPRSEGPRTVAGTVLSHRGGAPLGGAAVRLEDTDITAITGFDGSFVLRNVAPGDYVLRLDDGDRTTRRIRITVTAEGVHLGNLVLNPGAGFEPEVLRMGRGADVVATGGPAPPPPPPPSVPEAGRDMAAAKSIQEVEVRADFAALAVFEPALRTDAGGRARVRVRLPGSLTRYRVMAVAVSGERHFGTGEATVTARKELMARVVAPRFVNFGDEFELPVLVQNSTAERLEIDIAARAAGLRLDDGPARRVVLPPGERAEVRFRAAAFRAGTARVEVIAVAGSRSDAARADIPVYTPATAEAFATYGVIDDGAPVVIPVSRPSNVIPEFGGLEISITSTALHALTDAVLYLHRYPFIGAEQLSSRILAVAALRDVLAAFAAEQLPPEDELVASTVRDVALLTGLQNGDGGWGFWYVGEPSNPFVSVHAAHALQRAAAEGFDVSPAVLARALDYLRSIERSIVTWPLRERQSVLAYALYVRHRLSDASAAGEARRMASAQPDRVGGELPVEAAAWLLNVLASDDASRAATAELLRYLLNRVVETAGGAAFTDRYEDGAHLLLHSRRRTDAVVLDALIATDPASDLIPKLANGLLAHRVRGRWSGTQENAWVLLALNRYFRTYEAETPNFQSRVWLDRRFAGAHTFSGRTTERQHHAIPMPELLRADTATLLIAREGAGRMYYRAGLRYAPTDLLPDVLDRGFTVTRFYEAVDDTADVRRDVAGTWRVRAGARVRVRLAMTAPSPRTHVALVDPLPAGFEPLNPELLGTGFTDDSPPTRRPREPRPREQVRSTWFVHQNLRDDRAEAFATLVPAGVYEYTYLARATTPGRFVVPPPRAEMMYEPETFGRGAGDTVSIEVTAPGR